jgi:rRNA maturation RNase YbeY
MKKGTAVSTLSFIVTDERGRPVPAGGLARWLARVAPVRARGAVGIALVSDARVRALNLRYLGQDHATDVLSFPAGDSLPADLLAYETDKPRASRLRLRTKQARFGEVRRSAEGAAAARSRTRIRSTSYGAAAGTYLGDIVIARGVAGRQAHAAGHDEPTELRVLALHGLLHLLGYDHERDQGMMARVERRLRRKGGLAEGLLDRAAAPRVGPESFGPSARRPVDLPGFRQGQGVPVRRRGAAIR